MKTESAPDTSPATPKGELKIHDVPQKGRNNCERKGCLRSFKGLISIFKRSALNEIGSEFERHLPGSGFSCVKHKCIKCCIETSMPLSCFDVKRIVKVGFRLRDFAAKIGKEWCLRNSSGRCIFISEGGCRIYPIAPLHPFASYCPFMGVCEIEHRNLYTFNLNRKQIPNK